ncbi:MAG TPA: DNA ligase D [Stellaceae bacterium]|nr:DNA ligase D [Stellaceae bacterium]
MALEEYRRKRDFRKTPEPAGNRRRRKAAAATLAFVVQKHAARRLHYDFRLELGGVMKSWAVPKGPSLDPAEKRLAVEVEDHPIEYAGFEGVIPKGEYGGGTVLLWDRGSWTPLDPDPAAAHAKGMLKFALDGDKLHGKWMLVRLRGRNARDGDKNWLLVKERDDAARPGSGDAVIADHPESVETGRSIEAVAEDRDRVWTSGKGEIPVAPRRLVPGARKGPLPEKFAPQLATLAEEAPAGEEWLHEIKYDGYRLLARLDGGKVRLLTRGGLDWTVKFPELRRALAVLPVESALIDGELVAFAPDGTTSFSRLQDAIAAPKTDGLVYFAFDLLYRDGMNLTGATLADRKAALAEIIPHAAEGTLRYSDHQAGRGREFSRQARRFELEGIVSKRRDRPYRPGRSGDWLKVKFRDGEEFLVIGFTDPAGSREGFGALLLGYYDRSGKLHYAGRAGSGFAAAQLTALRQRLEGLGKADPPPELPKGTPLAGTHWVPPKLVAEVNFAGWTEDKLLRQASFAGLREDKGPSEVVYGPENPAKADPPAAAPPTPATPSRARDGSIVVAGVRLTHPDRALYPDPGFTKLDLARYWEAVAEAALAQLANRPLTLVRAPGGSGQKSFYQKHVGAGMPQAIRRLSVAGEAQPLPVVEDLPGLVALAQMDVLEIHPWGATVAALDKPDRVTFDLDPDEGVPWARVVEAALGLRGALRGIDLESFVKTTGGKGLHVVVPLAPRLAWDKAKAFSKWVADRLAEQFPNEFTANPAKRARTGRIYLDYLRNSRGATAVGAYSPRARPGAPVATPLSWEEVENDVHAADFTLKTVPQRLARLHADPWAEMADGAQTLSPALRRRIGI